MWRDFSAKGEKITDFQHYDWKEGENLLFVPTFPQGLLLDQLAACVTSRIITKLFHYCHGVGLVHDKFSVHCQHYHVLFKFLSEHATSRQVTVAVLR